MAKKRNLKTSLVMSLFLLAIVSTARAEIIYVDADASTGGDGQTWGTAYKYLQDGLGAGVSGDQIWVADGIYKPDANTGNPTGTGDRFATFELKNGVAIYAGFAGGESSLDERDWETNETILSGDLKGDDGPDFANNYDNSLHVVTASGTDETAVLDGFIITAGNANGSKPYDRGGGMYNDNGSPTLTNCTFIGNSAITAGGGMANYPGSRPTLTNCTFSKNSVRDYQGGGMANWSSSSTLTNCTFTGNSAYNGGGMFNYDNSSPTLTNCTFSGNAARWGGGMTNFEGGNPTLTNCMFADNTAEAGGGMYNRSSSRPTLTNCIICGNTASSGSQIYNYEASSATVSYSDVQGGWPGTGNIDANPLFVDSAIGDYHLKSQAGRWDPYSESWIMDDVTSPCIDRGDPNSPIGDEPDPNGGIINMGAYGGTPEASMSIGQLPPLPPLAHWKLDETEGDIAYDSAGVNDAFVIGKPLWQPTGGMVEGALELDGVDDCLVTPFGVNPAEGSFSIFAWVKGGAPGQTVISEPMGADWLAVDAEGKLMTELKSPGRDAAALMSQTVVADGVWHRVGLVWDGSQRMLCVDGVTVAEDTQDGLEASAGGLYIGTGKAMQPGTYFSGLIDDIRIYNRAVSP